MSIDINKCFDTNDAKFDELTNSLCSIDEQINEICRETKRDTDEMCIRDRYMYQLLTEWMWVYGTDCI